ncbi:MAG: transcriptional regulator [Phycisphaerae bacterium]|nr:transcriptional regulator [Phycisphaerae bacterium]|tara:strand:- start:62 stop:427 length:366 start_codon:yes stop_codon:yes gene_type:complete
MPTIHHPDLREVPVSTVLAALSDETRLNIVLQLKDGERCCGDMDVRASKSGLSHHMKVLRQAGIIRQRPNGTQRLTSLRTAEVEHRFPGLLTAVLRAASPDDDDESDQAMSSPALSFASAS